MKETTSKQVWVIPGWALGIGALIIILLLIAFYIMFWPRHERIPATAMKPQQHTIQEPAANPLPQQSQQPAASAAQAGPVLPPPAVEITIPASTPVTVRTSQLIDTNADPVGSRYKAMLASPLMVNGKTVVPQGSPVVVRLSDVRKTGFFHKSLQIKLALGGISVNGRIYSAQADSITLKPGNSNADQDSGGGSGKKALVVLPNTPLTFTLSAPLTISTPG